MHGDARTAHIDWLEKHQQQQIAFLSELVKKPSDNPPGDCAPHSECSAGLLEAMGFTVERHPVAAPQCREHGMISATNLIIRQRFGSPNDSGPSIALNAHGDVVAPGQGWTTDPYGAAIRAGCLYGRGAAVSKSDFATYAFALRALVETQAPLTGSIELHFTYDEEVGGMIGPKLLLDKGLSHPDYVISAGFSYAVVTAHNGCLHLEVTVTGKSAHAAKPQTGHDALEATTAVLAALYQHRSELSTMVSSIAGIGSANLTVGLIDGGINTNVVPDRVTLRLDRRLIPEEDPAQVEAQLRSLMHNCVADRAGISIAIKRVMLAQPLTPMAGVNHLSDCLKKHAEAIFTETIPVLGVPLYTDARHYAQAGIPTVLYGAGPRSIEEANAHRADECLPLADLHKATKVIACTLFELLSGHRIT